MDGLVADRSDKRRLMIRVQYVLIAHSAALAGLAFLESPPVPLIYAVVFVGGLAGSFEIPTRRSFVVETEP